MTLITAVPQTGALVDADIAINAADYGFCDAICAADQSRLAPVLLHEAGHFIGLDHSLAPGAMMAAAPEPKLALVGTLQPDDHAGGCAVYPARAATAACGDDAQGSTGSDGGSDGDARDGAADIRGDGRTRAGAPATARGSQKSSGCVASGRSGGGAPLAFPVAAILVALLGRRAWRWRSARS